MFTAKVLSSERKVRENLKPLSSKSYPVFIEKPENKNMMEGSNDFIEAVVNGNPFPTVTWYKGVRECPNGPKFTTEIDLVTGIAGLTIKKVKAEDEGKYIMKIANEIGEDKTPFSVFVKCK